MNDAVEEEREGREGSWKPRDGKGETGDAVNMDHTAEEGGELAAFRFRSNGT